MKKIGMLLLAMALLLAPFNVLPVHADDPSSDFYFTDNADGISVTITGYADSASRDYVVIPGTIDGKQVTAIGNEAFQNKSIQSLELPDSLVSIGTKAFFNNPLTSLEIPESVQEIGHGAFQLNKLTNLTLNDGLEKIGKSAFANNELTELFLPDRLTELGEYAFQQNKIVDLRLSNNLEEIGQYTFAFNKLTALDIPASVRTIGNSAFTANRILTLVIPETVATVKKDAFRYNALEIVTFLGTPILEDDMNDPSSGFFYQHSDEADSLLYNWYTDPEYTEVWNKIVAATPASPLTIYAGWQKNNVTFNANGGSGHVTKKVNFGEKTTAAISTKTEHTLEGWYKEEELINKWDFNTDVVTRNITLYAKWTANTYTVSFNLNGGTGTAPNQTIEYNGQAVAPANPSRAGHTFEGWYTNTSFTAPWNFDTDQVKRDMTLYAKWTASKYNVSFQSNGGSAVAAQTVSHGEKVVFPATPSRTGYTLEGWYTDSDLKTAWNFTTGVVKESMTLYAKWTVNTYTVSFQSNGGTAVANQTIAYENKVSLPADPIKANHTFAGWYTNPSLIWVWDFDLNVVRNDMTLYAKWTVNEYTVNFQSNGGTAVAAQTIAEDGKVASPIPPSKDGHAFAGWYADEELKTPWNFSTGVVKENMTLYAKWTVNTYTVSFQSNGGTAVAAQTVAHDGKITSPTNLSKSGHTFAGWYTDSNLTTAWNFSTGVVEGNMTLYAKWSVNAYTVSFQSNGGTVVAAQTIAEDGKVVSPTPPSKASHVFAGWYADEELKTLWNFSTGVVKENMTLYAKWTLNTYTVTFQSNGGTAVATRTLAHDSKITSPTNPSRSGHVFVGWYTDSKLTTAWNFSTGVVKGNMTLYAKWSVNAYTVSFQSNGGTAVAAQTIAEDGKVVSPTPPSKAGHAFVGWYTSADLKTPWNFETGVVKENMTLYAKWTVNTYTVTFQSNGGTAIAAQTVTHDGKITSPKSPSKSGHVFVGWYTDSKLTTAWNFETGVVKGNMTLYAKWTVNAYTVTFQSNGGTAIAAQTVAHDAKIVSPAIPKKSGYTFAGWYTDEELTLAWNFATDAATTDMTLYAKWSKIVYVPAPEPTVEPEPTIEPDPEIIPEEEPEQPVCSTDFSDISNHWAEAAIRDIASRCIIIGYPDGEFKPNAPLIRAHVAVMFARAFELSPNRSATPFNDVSSDSPYYEAIMKASQAGIFEGVNGSFYPEQHLTRAEMAKLLVTAFNLPLGGKSTFLDVPEAHWASSYIAALESYGLASGEDGYYKPDQPVTRAQFVAFMYRALYL